MNNKYSKEEVITDLVKGFLDTFLTGVIHQIEMNVRKLAHVMLPHSTLWVYQEALEETLQHHGVKMACGFWFCSFPRDPEKPYIDCLLYKDDAIFKEFMNAVTVAFYNPTPDQCHLSQVQIGRLFGYPEDTLLKEFDYRTFPSPRTIDPSRGAYFTDKVPLQWWSIGGIIDGVGDVKREGRGAKKKGKRP